MLYELTIITLQTPQKVVIFYQLEIILEGILAGRSRFAYYAKKTTNYWR